MIPTDKIIEARARAIMWARSQDPFASRPFSGSCSDREIREWSVAAARATIAADTAAGYWLAPMEATEEMLDAIRQSASVNGYHSRGAPLLYRAMRDAALAATPAQAVDLDRDAALYRADLALAQVETLRKALEWYADQMCEYGKYDEGCGKLDSGDCAGCKARAALAATPAQAEVEQERDEAVYNLKEYLRTNKISADRREEAFTAALAQVETLRKALESVMVGGNHVALLIGADHPPSGTSYDDALRHYGAGDQYEAWCCWNTIMQARAALAATPVPAPTCDRCHDTGQELYEGMGAGFYAPCRDCDPVAHAKFWSRP